MPHPLVDGFYHLHKFVFAELAIFVLIEFCEHLFWIWRVCAARAVRAAFAGLTASASTAHLAHFFALGALFIV
jgi:hypothetical protein